MINIQKNIILAPFTTFRIGGPAKFFVEVATKAELEEAFEYAKNNKLQFFVLGGGSNVLVNDDGFDGLVIKIKFTEFKVDVENDWIEAGAGVFLSKVVKESIGNSLTGMEWASGIPGTVGGATRGNAGAFGGETKDVVETVEIMDTKTLETQVCTKDFCQFGYRDSAFKYNKDLIILSVIFKLQKGSQEESRQKMQEIMTQRISKQPQGSSAGSFFVNPVVNNPELVKEFETEKNIQSKENKVPAGWLIDKADLRGKKMGGAMVSETHPNYIMNTGNATAEDVIMLVSFVKQQVRDKFGVELHEEVQYVGF